MECVGIKERITICGNGGKLEFDIDKGEIWTLHPVNHLPTRVYHMQEEMIRRFTPSSDNFA